MFFSCEQLTDRSKPFNQHGGRTLCWRKNLFPPDREKKGTCTCTHVCNLVNHENYTKMSRRLAILTERTVECSLFTLVLSLCRKAKERAKKEYKERHGQQERKSGHSLTKCSYGDGQQRSKKRNLKAKRDEERSQYNGHTRTTRFLYMTFTAKHISRAQQGVRHHSTPMLRILPIRRIELERRVKFVVTSVSIIMHSYITVDMGQLFFFFFFFLLLLLLFAGRCCLAYQQETVLDCLFLLFPIVFVFFL
jgi:hypothetical protein